MKACRYAGLIAVLWIVAPASALSTEIQWQEPESWSRIFSEAGVVGTAVVFDESAGNWLVHDPDRAERAYSPASTFKIFNAMVALDADAVADEYEVIRWDGRKRQYPAWNRDHSLASGMRFSVVWFYQAMARRIGAERMQAALNKVNYGNRDIGDAIDLFWLDNSLRISAKGQIDFLRELADGSLPLSEMAQETVRRITIIEDAPGWILHAKTGWALDSAADKKTDLGWIVGWLEREDRRWFFAINFDMPTAADAQKRLQLAKQLLTEAGGLTARP